MKHYDVVILGGAFSGAAAAVLLRRDRPDLSVLVVERLEAFDAKVGEATTEMSGMFLTRRLALWQHLEREHLPKEGLRYWFQNDKVHGHADASESGAFQRSTVPSFQLRRDVLDEHLLATAVAEGAELVRPAKVREVELGDFDHKVTLEHEGETETVGCRWVLDATGRANFLGKRLGLIERNREHPTAAVWCRWQGVRHIDDVAARGPLSLLARQRRLPAPGHQPLHGVRLLGLVHPPGQRRDQHRDRLRHPPRPARPRQQHGERVPRLPAGDPRRGRAARGGAT